MLDPEARHMSGVVQLGYLVFEVSDLAAWKDFGTKILGLHVVGDNGERGFGLRMDRERTSRIRRRPAGLIAAS